MRVFNDGDAHLSANAAGDEPTFPVLFAVGSDGGNTLVNYRYTGQYYLVDGVPASIALIDGSGKHQRRALITRGS